MRLSMIRTPTLFELSVQYPGHFYNKSMSKVFTDQLENENQRKIFWRSQNKKTESLVTLTRNRNVRIIENWKKNN